MRNVFYVVVPSELVSNRRELTAYLMAVDKTVGRMRVVLPEEVAPPPKDKEEYEPEKRERDDDDDYAMMAEEMDTPPKKQKGKADPDRLFRKNQIVEVNFHDWSQFKPFSESRVPCKIVALLDNGTEAAVRPLKKFDGECIIADRKAKGRPTTDMIVPLERLELLAPIIELTRYTAAIGDRVEVAWRSCRGEPVAWWAAMIIETKGEKVKVRYDNPESADEWVPLAVCRRMKRTE
jgi:hypothetical protein